MAEPKGSGQKTVNIGVFVPYISQLLDVAVVDVFGTMSHQYLSVLPGIPSVVASVAPHVNIYYVGSVAAGQPIELTSGMCMLCTHHLSDPAVAPGMLDLVVVPGVDPKLEKFDDDVVAWLAAQAACEETDILSVCTGIFLCGAAGILKGRKASGPRGPLQHEIRRRYEGVELVGDEYRWVRDGRIWSSGGITNGNDMVAAYARQSKHFPRPIAHLGCELTDVGDRDQVYSNGRTFFTVGIVWRILRAYVLSLSRKKSL